MAPLRCTTATAGIRHATKAKANRPLWSWRHDALVLALALAVVACAHVTRAQDESSSTGEDAGSGGSSSSGEDVSSSSSADAVANHTRRNSTSPPGQFTPAPQPNVTTRYCDLPEPPNGMRVYDNTTVCFVVGGRAKILFYVNVDEFSVAQIIAPKNSTALPNRTGLWDHPRLWFQAEYGSGVSPMKYRHPQVDDPASDAAAYVVPYWTLIITLKNGLVETLEWDDGCYGCSGDACVDSTCAVDPVATGCTDVNSRADCNPKFFVSWFGTDRDGVYLTSSGSRSSRFRAYSLSSAVGNAYQSASSAVELSVKNQNVQFKVDCTSDPSQCETEPGT